VQGAARSFVVGHHQAHPGIELLIRSD
jgi:hypothetical protein